MSRARDEAHTMCFNKCKRDSVRKKMAENHHHWGPRPVSVQWPPAPCAQIGRQEIVKILFLQEKLRALIPILPSKFTCTLSCLKARPLSHSLLHSQRSTWNLKGVNACLLNQWTERSAFPQYFTLISANGLDTILETPLPTWWVLGMSHLILFVK